MSTLVALFTSSLTPFSRIYTILDGLDECTLEQFNNIVSLLNILRSSSVSIFCTSRPHSLERNAKLEPCEVIEIKARGDDIENYVSQRLDNDWKHSKELKPKVVEKLVNAAEGKWVYYFISLLTLDFFWSSFS